MGGQVHKALRTSLEIVQAATLAILALFLFDYLLSASRWSELFSYLYDGVWALGLLCLGSALVNRPGPAWSRRDFVLGALCIAAVQPVRSGAMLRLGVGHSTASLLILLLGLLGWWAHRRAARILKRQVHLESASPAPLA
jgi:hypothetical protein